MIDRRKIEVVYSKLSKEIKNFLLSKQSREFFVFLFFFFIAGAFWLLQTLNDDYEAELTMPIRLRGVPDNIIVTSDLPSSLKVKVKDKGVVLLNYMVAKNLFPIVLDFEDHKGVNNHVKISASEFERKIASQLNASTRLLSVQPDTLEYIYSAGISKLVPVRLKGKVTSGRHYYIPDTLYSPDSVLVYAPGKILDAIDAAFTENIYLENISDTTTYQVALLPIKGVKYVPNIVSVTFPVDVYTEKTVEVPIVGIHFPDNKVLRTFPSRVKVTFRIGMSKFKEVNAEDFVIHVSYNDLIHNTSDKYQVSITAMPAIVSNVQVSPGQIDFLIEQIHIDVN